MTFTMFHRIAKHISLFPLWLMMIFGRIYGPVGQLIGTKVLILSNNALILFTGMHIIKSSSIIFTIINLK